MQASAAQDDPEKADRGSSGSQTARPSIEAPHRPDRQVDLAIQHGDVDDSGDMEPMKTRIAPPSWRRTPTWSRSTYR
jgi:hypothetical protein